MNAFVVVTLAVLALAVSPAVAVFFGGVGESLSLGLAGAGSTTFTSLSGGSLAVGSGFLTSAGVVAAGAGLLGAAVVGAALAAQAVNRKKRDVGDVAALQLIDSYFMTILDVDVDDCGKKLVCEIRTLDKSERNVEENLISNLFETSTTIDPLSAKAEYDLAAFIGDNYSKEVCARRYHRCTYDRKVIISALQKLEKQEENQAQQQQSKPAQE